MMPFALARPFSRPPVHDRPLLADLRPLLICALLSWCAVGLVARAVLQHGPDHERQTEQHGGSQQHGLSSRGSR